MEYLTELWTWLAAHPAQAAWAAFALLSALVGAYKLNEEKIKAAAAESETTADDKAIAVLDGIVAIFEVLRLLAPHVIARPKALPKTEKKD